jgi:hypothetical protein
VNELLVVLVVGPNVLETVVVEGIGVVVVGAVVVVLAVEM